MRSKQPPAPKKPYSKPSVRFYGNVPTLTATVGNASTHHDGGFGTKNRTH
jgi:hypothetical protein